MVFFILTVLVLTLIVLGFSSHFLVSSLTRLSSSFRLPKFLLAFVILGLGTSLPDMFVAGFAASEGQANLLLGSIIGANVIVLCLVLGIVTLRKGRFKVRESTVIENFGWIFLVLIIPFFLLFDGRLTWMDGLILVAVYSMYLYNIREQEMVHAREREQQLAEASGQTIKAALVRPQVAESRGPAMPQKAQPSQQQRLFVHFTRQRLVEVGKVAFFLALVLVSSKSVVESTASIIAEFQVSSALFGFSVLALGLALPEFALDLSALRAREEEIIWGDLIGSFVTELTLVLGLAAIVGSTLVFDFSKFMIGYAFMVLVFLLVFLFAYKKKELTRSEGIVLIILYLVFLSIQFDYFLFTG